jgi:hypothetical protein
MSSDVSLLKTFFANLSITSNAPASDPQKTETRHIVELAKKAIRDLALDYEKHSNPFATNAQKLSIDWINQHHVILDPEKIHKIAASNFGIFIGKAHPRADLQTLSIISDFATWLFIYDDMIESCKSHEDIQKLHARTLTILNGSKADVNDNALTKGLAEVTERVEKVCKSSLWRKRLLDDVRNYCEGTLWELSNRRQSKTPSLSLYREKRPATSGTKVMFNFIEIAENITIPKEIFISPYFQQIRLLGANLVNWENDLLSAPKEFLKDFHNLVFVYREEENVSYEAAFQFVVRELQNDLKKFLELSDEVPDFGTSTDDVKTYIRGVKEWIAGHDNWAKESPRYISYFES